MKHICNQNEKPWYRAGHYIGIALAAVVAAFFLSWAREGKLISECLMENPDAYDCMIDRKAIPVYKKNS